MKTDDYLYMKVYQALKSRIVSGYYTGERGLPSCPALCEEYQVSDITIRKVLGMLEKEGLVAFNQRKALKITYAPSPINLTCEEEETMWRQISDILSTVQLITPPIVQHGLSLFSEGELDVLNREIDERLRDDVQDHLFWRAPYDIWKKVSRRIHNPLISEILDTFNLFFIPCIPLICESRTAYYQKTKQIINQARLGRYAEFPALYPRLVEARRGQKETQANLVELYRTTTDMIDMEHLDSYVNSKEYSSFRIQIDLIQEIADGTYQKGSYLPTHQALCDAYGVSINTTIRALKKLQRLKIVRPRRGLGNQVLIDAAELAAVSIDGEDMVSFIRRFLNKLQLEVLTVREVAIHAANHTSQQERQALYRESMRLDALQKGCSFDHIYQFIFDHIRYRPLKSMYALAYRNFFNIRWMEPLFAVEGEEAAALRGMMLHSSEALQDGRIDEFGALARQHLQYSYELLLRNLQDSEYKEAIMDL